MEPLVTLATKLIAAASAGLVLAACAADNSGNQGASGAAATANPDASSGVALTGAGATFPQPIYSKWFSDYAAQKGVKINYQSIGSGGGVRQIMEQTVDFGASDAPMSDEDLARAKGGPILHIPTVLGADVITYNVPEIGPGLKLTGDVIADIFLGKIKKWNDPRIATLNTGTRLPASDILVVHRSDGSGTTFIFTDYLSAVSPEWKRVVGKGKEVKWPTGIGAKGNEGVAGQVKQTPGSIAYVELAYAKQNQLPYASVRNSAGQFVQPTMESIYAAAESAAPNIPPNSDYRISIVNPPGANAYPIASFTWLLVYRNPTDANKARLLNDFLKWALTDGSASARALDFGPLPPAMAERLKARLDSMKVGSGS
jgi:phosphate transport system substrate-binding protein